MPGQALTSLLEHRHLRVLPADWPAKPPANVPVGGPASVVRQESGREEWEEEGEGSRRLGLLDGAQDGRPVLSTLSTQNPSVAVGPSVAVDGLAVGGLSIELLEPVAGRLGTGHAAVRAAALFESCLPVESRLPSSTSTEDGEAAECEPGETSGIRRKRAEGSGGLLQVGDLARATGKTVRAIHLYEEQGLLKPQNRSKGRYRLFSAESVVRVRWITKLQNLGLSLAEIKELVRGQEDSNSAVFAAAKLREVYDRKLQETRQKIQDLRNLETELEESLVYLSTCDTTCMPDLPTEVCSNCTLHHDQADAPDLVAGVRAC